jgi:hypothetical protein
MRRWKSGLWLLAATGTALNICLAGKLENTSFEDEFGQREELSVWGEYGDLWGQARQVTAGAGATLKAARSGERMVLLDVPPATWNGIWQQVPWAAGTPFAAQGFYMIAGGDLPDGCATFLKVEFYDGSDKLLGHAEGEKKREDTHGQWLAASVEGTTPAETESLRVVLIAGDNVGGEMVKDRIFWDDVDTKE